jgi:hypothetical protein
MKRLDFDVLGVEENGIINGYIERISLEIGHCNKYQRTFQPSELIAESTPLIDLFPILRDVQRVFVLDRNKVSAIVTRGDMQKAPVRMLLFGLVTLLEMNLLRLIRIYYPNDSWQEFLNDEHLEEAKNRLSKLQAKNEAIDLADCLQFCDKRNLIIRRSDICKHLILKSKRSGDILLRDVEDLRNNLAHSQDIVTGSSWPKVIKLAKEIEVLLERCEQIEKDDKTCNT